MPELKFICSLMSTHSPLCGGVGSGDGSGGSSGGGGRGGGGVAVLLLISFNLYRLI